MNLFQDLYQLVEGIICLLLGDKGCMSCKFVLKMLKIVSFLGAFSKSTKDHYCSFATQHYSLLSDLITSLYNVDLVQSIV